MTNRSSRTVPSRVFELYRAKPGEARLFRPGAICVGQLPRLGRLVVLGDVGCAGIRAAAKNDAGRRVTMETNVAIQRGDDVITGQADAITPAEKVGHEHTVLVGIDVGAEAP